MKEESLKKETYQKPEIKSGSFELGVYGRVGNYSPTEGPDLCLVDNPPNPLGCELLPVGVPGGCLVVAQVEPGGCDPG